LTMYLPQWRTLLPASPAPSGHGVSVRGAPMSTLTFDVPANPADLDASFDSLVVVDNDGNPNLVVDVTDSFSLVAKWHLSGSLSPVTAGTWTVRAFAEWMGPGPELQIAVTAVPLGANPNYQAPLSIPPNTLPAGPPASGLYKLAVVITHEAFGI